MSKELLLSKKLYNIQCIRSTIGVYSKIAVMGIVEEKEYYRVIFKKCQYDEEQTVREFENYLIGMENT